MRKVLFIAYLCVVALVGSNLVSAASYSVDSKVPINILVNGNQVNLKTQPMVKNGRVLVPADALFNRLGADYEYEKETGFIRINHGPAEIHLELGSTAALVNGTPSQLEVVPVFTNHEVYLPIRFMAESLATDVIWNGADKTINIVKKDEPGTSRGNSGKKFVVVIDAGHGGYESGAVYGGIKEKNLNLDVSKRLNKLLKAEGITTYMTREGDSYMGLYERSAFANQVNADLFISIHHNAGYKRDKGSMALYYPTAQTSSSGISAKTFASIIQKEMVSDLKMNNLGIYSRPRLAVLRTTSMPAVIAEIGYMSNRTELKKISTSSFKQKAAESLRDGVLKALARM